MKTPLNPVRAGIGEGRRALIVSLLVFLALAPEVLAAGSESSAQMLFNGRDLEGWDTYLGVKEVPGLPFDPFGTWDEPIGRNVDPTGVFSVVDVDGEPAIRISGEIWGALISRSEYQDYHLSLEYKWGSERHAPRDEAPPNTGLLYHSVGPDGAFWSYWMRSVEFEIMEGRTGDLTSVDGIEATTNSAWDRSAGYPWLRYSESEEDGQTSVSGAVFRIAASENFESPADQWTRVWRDGAVDKRCASNPVGRRRGFCSTNHSPPD